MTINHNAFVDLALEHLRAIQKTVPGWRDYFGTGTADGLRLEPGQCASLIHYFDCLEEVVRRLAELAPTAPRADATHSADVLQFPARSHPRRPSTPSGGGDAA